jgi:hypothetical protein
MIKFKEGGLIDRLVTIYGRCPEEDKSNFCTIWWRAIVGLMAIGVICVLPTVVVLTDLHLYYVKVVGVDSLLFSWFPEHVNIWWVILGGIWAIIIVGSLLLQVGVLFLLVVYLLVITYNKVASIAIINYTVKSYFEPLSKAYKPISTVTKPLTNSISNGISNVKEIYKAIKDKYCPTVVWVKEEDK